MTAEETAAALAAGDSAIADPPSPAPVIRAPGAKLGAVGTNDLPGLQMKMNARHRSGRGHRTAVGP